VVTRFAGVVHHQQAAVHVGGCFGRVDERNPGGNGLARHLHEELDGVRAARGRVGERAHVFEEHLFTFGGVARSIGAKRVELHADLRRARPRVVERLLELRLGRFAQSSRLFGHRARTVFLERRKGGRRTTEQNRQDPRPNAREKACRRCPVLSARRFHGGPERRSLGTGDTRLQRGDGVDLGLVIALGARDGLGEGVFAVGRPIAEALDRPIL
jgi:hypothetical protein